MTKLSVNDAKELALFEKFLLDYGAHKALEKVVGKRLPLETPNVPREWWNPQNDLTRAPE